MPAGESSVSGRQQTVHLLDGQHLGQKPRLARQVEPRGQVRGDQPLRVAEPVEAPQRRRFPAEGGGPQRRPATPARRGQHPQIADRDVGRGVPLGGGPAAGGEVQQVGAVGPQRRGGQPALDSEVDQEVLYRRLQPIRPACRGAARRSVRPAAAPAISFRPGRAAPGVRPLQELLGARPRAGPALRAGEHLGQLLDPLVDARGGEPRSRCDRRAGASRSGTGRRRTRRSGRGGSRTEPGATAPAPRGCGPPARRCGRRCRNRSRRRRASACDRPRPGSA